MESNKPETREPAGRNPLAAQQTLREQETKLRQDRTELDLYCAALEKLVEDLADQRLHLAEQCERYAIAQKHFQEEREAAGEKQKVDERLLRNREQELQEISKGLSRQREAAAQAQTCLETLQTRLTTRLIAWDAERQLWTAQLGSREDLVERLLTIVAELHSQWRERHHLESEYFQSLRQELTGIRRDLVARRDLWLHRCEELERENAALFRRLVSFDKDSEGSQTRLNKELRAKWDRRFAALSVHWQRTLDQERQALESEAVKLEQRLAQLQSQEQKIATREVSLAAREVDLEHARAVAEIAYARMRQELHSLKDQNAIYQRQVTDLQEQVERLAGLLLKEENTVTLSVAKAA